MRYGIYCGSFSPVHKGHTAIMHETLRQKASDKVIVVPTGDYWQKSVSIPLRLRIECLRLFESEQILINSDPADNAAANTLTLMENLQRKHPKDELALILGADNLLHFESWYCAEELLRRYHFIIMNRDEIDAEAELARLGKQDYSILNCPRIDVRSSFIMANITNPAAIEGLLDERVMQKMQMLLQ